MLYTKISIPADPQKQELLIAILGDLPFDVFEEKEDSLDAYMPTIHFEQDVELEINNLTQEYDFSYTIEHLPDENWNTLWESHFEPVIVDDFCSVRATFHAPIPSTKYEIVIDPKMSFGTGHHATTYMVMKAMESIDFKNKKVLDFGSGTAILAILAKLLGAKPILAIDNDEWCYHNGVENVALNQSAAEIEVLQATITDIPVQAYDIIIANINTHILLQYVENIATQVVDKGVVILSGIMLHDVAIITTTYENNGLQLLNSYERGEWACLVFQK